MPVERIGHLAEARLPPGKIPDNFDFAIVAMLSKARRDTNTVQC